MEYDLLNIPEEIEMRRHKLRRTVPAPNSYFLKIKCPTCKSVVMAFSHAQNSAECTNCNQPIAKTSGGKIRISNKCEINILTNKKDKN